MHKWKSSLFASLQHGSFPGIVRPVEYVPQRPTSPPCPVPTFPPPWTSSQSPPATSLRRLAGLRRLLVEVLLPVVGDDVVYVGDGAGLDVAHGVVLDGSD